MAGFDFSVEARGETDGEAAVKTSNTEHIMQHRAALAVIPPMAV